MRVDDNASQCACLDRLEQGVVVILRIVNKLRGEQLKELLPPDSEPVDQLVYQVSKCPLMSRHSPKLQPV